MNEIEAEQAIPQVPPDLEAEAAREQQAAVTLWAQVALAHIASRNTAVALVRPVDAEVDIVLRFPRYSLKCIC